MIGSPSETKACNLAECPTWAKWGGWTACSFSCGGGSIRTRERQCIGDFKEFCKDFKQTEPCDWFQPCPKWLQWSQWSECSKSCDNGEQFRLRNCSNGDLAACDENDENRNALDGGISVQSQRDSENNVFVQTAVKNCSLGSCSFWEPWSSWSACSTSCGIGEAKRTRQCAGDFLADCKGNSMEVKRCILGECSYWAPWSSWGPCTKTCGEPLNLELFIAGLSKI